MRRRRRLVRFLLIAILLGAAMGLLFGDRFGIGGTGAPGGDRPAATGTSGRDTGVIDPERARERAGQLGEKVAVATNETVDTIEDVGLTTKIKSKMALDDVVLARAIDVDTQNGVVTLSGRVRSDAERRRAVQLAKETVGVKSVIDRLEMR